jgi:hypothetical protein
VNWRIVGVVTAALVIVVRFLLPRSNGPKPTLAAPRDAPPRPKQRLAIGQAVVLNALGVGKVEDFAVRPLGASGEAWGYVIKVRSYEAFARADKVPGLVWPLCDRATAEAMYKAILEPDTSREFPGGEERTARMMALWANGSHLQQAELLGQLLHAPSPGDSAMVMGTAGHILREIAFVLGITLREVDARLEARFPNWRQHLPPRDPDDV